MHCKLARAPIPPPGATAMRSMRGASTRQAPACIAKDRAVHRARNHPGPEDIRGKNLQRDRIHDDVEVARLIAEVAKIKIEHVRAGHQRQAGEIAADYA